MRISNKSTKTLIPQEVIAGKIYRIRGIKVMLDFDLAPLYGVRTKVLNQAMKRNIKRFPHDFMIQLSNVEYESLRSQIVTLKRGRGQHRKYLPYAFSEPGVAMLSSVLNSETAIQINIQIIRTFIKLREAISNHKNFKDKIAKMEKKMEENFGIYDKQFKIVFEAFEEIKKLLAPPSKPKKRIGFHHD